MFKEQLQLLPKQAYGLDMSLRFQGRIGASLARVDLFEEKNETDEQPSELSGMGDWIRYFDTNWKQINLSKDWHNLKTQDQKRVGFIMHQQMDLLKDPYEKEGLSDWVQKTKRDLEGFKLEFLSDNVVYPRKYRRNPSDSMRLEDPLYGKAKDGKNIADVEELTSEKERNGSVKRAIGKMKDFFSDAPDGSIVVITSPLGPTGFKTKDGLAIDYPDSYFFIMQKEGDEVMNYTLKTDFTLAHCREVIKQLTGKELSSHATLEAYVDSLACIKPGDNGISDVHDVIQALEAIQPSHAFIDNGNAKITEWGKVRDQIDRGEELYQFDKQTKVALDGFEEYAKEGTHTKGDLQKAIAATIIRMGDTFFEGGKRAEDVVLRLGEWSSVRGERRYSYGAIVEKIAERRGCSGGGDSSKFVAVSSLTTRIGLAGGSEDEYGSLDFECPDGHKNTRPRGQLISHCATCGISVSC